MSLGLCKSKSEAQRLIKAGAVYLASGDLNPPNWVRIDDPAHRFDPAQYHDYTEVAFKVGRNQCIYRLKSAGS